MTDTRTDAQSLVARLRAGLIYDAFGPDRIAIAALMREAADALDLKLGLDRAVTQDEMMDCYQFGTVDYAPLPQPDAESDGALLSRLGDDASKWAAEFRRIAIRLGYSDMDEGWLISWFANAIEHSETVRRAATQAPAGDDVERAAEALRREMSDEQWTFERLARAALAAVPERGRASIPSDDELGPENDVDFLAWFEQVNEAMPDSVAKTAMRRALKLSAAAETRGMMRAAEIADEEGDNILGGIIRAATSQPAAQPDVPRVVDHPEAGYSEWLREDDSLKRLYRAAVVVVQAFEKCDTPRPLAPRPCDGEKA